MSTDRVAREFSRYATHYTHLASLQMTIARRLIAPFATPYRRILDLGAGSGALRKAWGHPFERFVAVDLAEGMCHLHPQDPQTITIVGDFDNPACWQRIAPLGPFDLILSSSALQWSRDPVSLTKRIANEAPAYGIALFIEGTFRTLHQQAGISHPLPAFAPLIEVAHQAAWERESYLVKFANGRELLSYIKRSGLNGRGNVLSARDALRLCQKLDDHPVLEFEVLYLRKM